MADDEAPYCECGCGERVRSRKRGVWSRWRPGHAYRKQPLPLVEVLTGETQLSMFPDIAPDKAITKRVVRCQT